MDDHIKGVLLRKKIIFFISDSEISSVQMKAIFLTILKFLTVFFGSVGLGCLFGCVTAILVIKKKNIIESATGSA